MSSEGFKDGRLNEGNVFFKTRFINVFIFLLTFCIFTLNDYTYIIQYLYLFY